MTEIQQLTEEFKQWAKENSKTKEQALATLVRCGILDTEGEFTEPYKNLNKMFE
jgi:hypothetical protein